MRINEVEKATGVPKKSIRFYEEEGLLTPSREEGNDYRSYGERELTTLRQIKLLRQLAIPIPSIRLLLEGTLPLSDCMAVQTEHMEQNIVDLQHIAAICQGIAAEKVSLAALDIESLNRRMQEMAEGGVRFMEPKHDVKRRKMIGPVIAAVLFVVLFGFFVGMFLWDSTQEFIPVPLLIVVVLVFLALIVGVLLALRQRIREIKGGEEDEALHY